MNSERHFRLGSRSKWDWTGLTILVVVSAIAGLLFLTTDDASSLGWQLMFTVAATAVIAIVIWQACDPFAEAAQWVGARFRIPDSVRGATLDAIASSMPELFSGIFFVVVAMTASDPQTRLLQTTDGFGSSIAICAGSSIYNLVLIPAICAIAIASVRPSKPQIEFDREVITRDGVWVIGSQLGLLVILFLPRLYWWMGLVALAAYAIYIAQLITHTRSHRRQTTRQETTELPPGTSLFFGVFETRFNAATVAVTLIASTALAAVACYFLVELTNHAAAVMQVPPFFVAVILAAAASSIPDTFLSLGAARRGDDSGAISNVFGSNIFDICVGMSIPLLVCCYLNDWQPLELIGANRNTIQGVAGLRVVLFALTAIVMFALWRKRVITRSMGYFFCGLYLSFVAYAVIWAR